MDNAVYNHTKKNLNELRDKQSEAWRKLKHLKSDYSNRVFLSDDERFELEQSQHRYNSLTQRIYQLKERLITFKFTG